MTHPLPLCVSSLQSSISLLSSSISILSTSVNDFPRLSKVLQTTRHFELLPESSLQTAQSALLSTLTPELSALFARIEALLDKLSRREQSLIARCELQEGRLSSARMSGAGGKDRNGSGYGGRGEEDGDGEGDGDGEMEGGEEEEGEREEEENNVEQGREALRLKQMRQKKERLSYAVERLTLQAQQRERQLRMSMAGQ